MGIVRSVSQGMALAGVIVAGGALAVTARSVLATPQPLESALEGESRIFRFRQGDVFYKVRGPAGAPPILLLHSIHLSASSFEWRKNFSALSQEFRVYAPDLPGFGLSDRPAIDYNANLYITLITDFAREIIGRPTMIVARGQTAAFSTRAAYLDPQLFNRLIFISPSGIATAAPTSGDGHNSPATALRSAVCKISETTVGEVPYAFLTTKSALSLLVARQSYANSEQVTPDLVRHLFATTHQYGARYAPLAFMAGKLDIDVASDFSRLQEPVLLVWGEQDAINEPLHAEELRALNPRSRLELISRAGNAVQDEQSGEINELLRAWLLAPAELVDPSRLGQAVESAAPATPPASAPTPQPAVSRPEPPAPPAPSMPTPAVTGAPPAQKQPPASDADLPPDIPIARAAEPVIEKPQPVTPAQALKSEIGQSEQQPLPTPATPETETAPTYGAAPAAETPLAPITPPGEPEATVVESPTDQVIQVSGPARVEDPTAQVADLMAETEAQAAAEMLEEPPSANPPSAQPSTRIEPRQTTPPGTRAPRPGGSQSAARQPGSGGRRKPQGQRPPSSKKKPQA